VIGPLIWAAAVELMTAENFLVKWIINILNNFGLYISVDALFTIQYRFAVLSLAILMSIGLFLFGKVPDTHKN